MRDLVLGIDAGGTSSRAALFTVGGEPVGRGRAAGGNPVALGMDRAAANLAAAVASAASGGLLSHVRWAVVGLAGHPGRCRSLAERLLRPLLPDGAGMRVVGDIVTAFAAGTSSPSGTVLISGTGAIAAKITDHKETATADGYGWLLGDEGSAFWIGHAAARATIRALATAAALPTSLTSASVDMRRSRPVEDSSCAGRAVPVDPPMPGVARATNPGTTRRDDGRALGAGNVPGSWRTPANGPVPGPWASAADVTTLAAGPATVNHGSPDPGPGAVDLMASSADPGDAATAGWGPLGELVLRHLVPEGVDGDPVAQVAAAVHARSPLALAELAPLVSQAAEAGDPVAEDIVAAAASRLARTAAQVHEPGLPIVLAGGVLTAEGPVRRAVQGLLEGAVTAGDPAGAAAWLAAAPLLGPGRAAHAHQHFVAPVPQCPVRPGRPP